MGLKGNVNRIHSELCEKYSVNIEEGSDRKMGNFVKLSVSEGKKNLVAFLSKTELENNNFNWFYSPNPLNEKSELIQRNSSLSDFINHVSDIFEKNRFDSEYLKKIK